MSGCAFSHTNSFKDIVSQHGMEFYASASIYIAAHTIVAKLLKSDIKVASLVGTTTSLGFYTIFFIDHRYFQNNETTHFAIFRLVRTAMLFFANLQVIKYFSMQGRPISYFWAFASTSIPYYLNEMQILNSSN